MCDDFDENEAEIIVLEKSWKKNVTELNKEGYREGVDAGKEESVQAGFNDAFAAASTQLFQVAKLRGNIGGRLSMNLLRPGTLQPESESLLQELLQDVCTLESDLLKFSPANLNQARHAATQRHLKKNDGAASGTSCDIDKDTAVKEDVEKYIYQDIMSSKNTIIHIDDPGKEQDVTENQKVESREKNEDDIACRSENKLGSKGDSIWVDEQRCQTETRLEPDGHSASSDRQSGSGEKVHEIRNSKTSEDPVRFKHDNDANTATENPVFEQLRVLKEKYQAMVG